MGIKIALSGKLRSGKTTVRELFENIGKDEYNIDFINLPLATPIYKEAHSFYERHGLVWDTKPRKLLEGIGEALNDKYPHGDKIVELYKDELETKIQDNILIDDMRRTTQANFLKERGFKLIRIECTDGIRKYRCLPGEWSEGSITDIELDDYGNFDYKIVNNEPSTETGLKNLTKYVKSILDDIISKG